MDPGTPRATPEGMAEVAKTLLAASLLAAAGCCWDTSENACVAPWGVRQTCTNVPDPYPFCLWDDPEQELPPLVTCEGAFHGGESCEDLGFTVQCGSWWLRPGDACS